MAAEDADAVVERLQAELRALQERYAALLQNRALTNAYDSRRRRWPRCCG